MPVKILPAAPGLPLRRLDIRVKLLGFVMITIGTFLFENPLYHLVMLIPLAIILAIVHFPADKIRALLFPLLPLFLLIMVFTSLSYGPERFHWAVNRTMLWHLIPDSQPAGILGGGASFCGGVTLGGIMLGLTFMLRVTLLTAVSALFAFISPLDDLLQLFQKAKVPYEVSFIIITALDRKRQLILDAQKARGANVSGRGLKHWFRAQIPVMIPLVINSIIMADALAMAMLNRGFGYARTRTQMRQLSFTAVDYWVSGAMLLVVGGGIYLRFGLQWGRL